MRSRFLLVFLSTALVSTFVPAQVELYGDATPGTGSVAPMIWATATPRPGETKFGLTIESGKPNANAVILVSDAPVIATVAGVKVFVRVPTAFQLPFVKLDKNGAATRALPLPNLRVLLGLNVFAQGFVADSGAKTGIAATRALDLMVVDKAILTVAMPLSQSNKSALQSVIDLRTGKAQTFTHSSIVFGSDVAFTKRKTHALFTNWQNKTGAVTMFDMTASPPKYVAHFKGQNMPWTVAMHPDGLRAYVVNQGRLGTSTEVQTVWAHPNSKSWGKPVKAAPVIKMNGLNDGLEFVFSPDGKRGVLASNGWFGNGPRLWIFDTDLSSKTLHKKLKTFSWIQRIFVYSYGILRDNKTLAIGITTLGQNAEVWLYDMDTGKYVDVDTKTFGVQPFGKEKSRARVPFGRIPYCMAVGPRGKYLYVGCSAPFPNTSQAEIIQIVADRTDKDFGKYRVSGRIDGTFPIDIAVDAVGAKLYTTTVVVGAAKPAIHEMDAITLKALRTWPGYRGAHGLAVR